MSKIQRLRKNFFVVIFFNVLMLLVGVGLSLLLPKYLPKPEYAIYRLLTFYITYSIFLHLGYLDGVYLFFGGKNLYELDKKENSKIFSTFVGFQLVLGALFMIVLFFVLGGSPNRDVYLLIVVDMVMMNLIYFYHYISQMNEKFTLYSVMFILTRVVVLVMLFPLTYFGITSGVVYVYINIIVNILIFAYYYIFYIKQVRFNLKLINIETLKMIMNIGFPIFLGGVVGATIMGIDRFVVDVFYTETQFADYSFAVSIIGMFIIFITAVTRLIFPYLKLLKPENILKTKYILSVGLITLMALTISGYYPLKYIIEGFLPDYIDSLGLVFILLPLLIFKAEIDISISNVYKAKLLRRMYFRVNVISFILGVIVFVLAYFLNGSLTSIAYACTITYGIWYLISDLYLHITLSKGGYDKYLYLVMVIATYFLVGYTEFNDLIKFVVYLGIIFVISGIYLFLDRNKIKEAIKLVREDLNN